MPDFMPDAFAFFILGCFILKLLLYTSFRHLLVSEVVEIIFFTDVKES